ncbi:MAG: hypothetical protein EOO01_32490, partial [Chitinophagaceae bacterium]
PNLFLVTNFVAIPLSSVILIAEIVLCCISFITPLATLAGKLIHQLIALMNWFVELVNGLPLANWKSLQISFAQELLLYVAVAGMSFFFMKRIKASLFITTCGLLVFFLLRTLSFVNALNQQKLIVYNIAKMTAMELIEGRYSVFAGDSEVIKSESIFRFNIAPSRTYHRIRSVYLPAVDGDETLLLSSPKGIIAMARGPVYMPSQVHILVISGNPRGSLRDLLTGLMPGIVVFDSSNPGWRVKSWKQDCVEMNLNCYSVADEGAFVMNLN